MKTFTLFLLLFASAVGIFFSGGHFNNLKNRAMVVNNYHNAALVLAKENRALQHQIGELKYQIQTLETKNNFLTIKLSKKDGGARTIASVKPAEDLMHPLVKYETFKWKPKQLAMIGNSSFKDKDYEKASQFFDVLITKYPRNEVLNDRILFQAGVAAYESKNHYDWAKKHLSLLVTNYPTSKHYRGAKLWLALANLRTGEHDKFYEVVEEFRLKYRNTDEWKILSGHYEELRQKYK